MHTAPAAFALLCLCTPAIAAAQTDAEPVGRGLFGIETEPLIGPLVADRPDFTESAVTIPRGHLQIETGITVFDDPDLVTLPEALFRLGVTRDLELRLRLPDYFDLDDGPDAGSGITDMSIGAKWRFMDQDGLFPDLAVIPFFTLPTGDSPLGADDVEFGATLAAGWDIGNELSLGANIGFLTFERSGGDDTIATSTSISLGIPLAEDTGAFVEYFAIYPGSINDSAHQFDTGVTHHIRNNLMVDARIGVGLNDDAPDFFIGAGVTYRY